MTCSHVNLHRMKELFCQRYAVNQGSVRMPWSIFFRCFGGLVSTFYDFTSPSTNDGNTVCIIFGAKTVSLPVIVTIPRAQVFWISVGPSTISSVRTASREWIEPACTSWHCRWRRWCWLETFQLKTMDVAVASPTQRSLRNASLVHWFTGSLVSLWLG